MSLNQSTGVVFVALLGLTAPAVAAPISGTFSGVGGGRYGDFGPTGTFTDQAATGTFSIDPTGCQPLPYGQQACAYTAAHIQVSYADGFSNSYDSTVFDASFYTMSLIINTPTSQTLNLSLSYGGGYSAGGFSLTGRPGAFATGTDLSTLHPGAVTSGVFSFQPGRSFYSDVMISSVAFDGASSSLPEPATLALLAGAMLGAGALRRKQA